MSPFHSQTLARLGIAEDLGAPISWAWGKTRDWLRESNHLVFLRENQDVCAGTQYRFSRAGGPTSTGAGGRLLLTATPDQTDWWFTADDEATLTALAQELWDCADLPTAWSNDPRGEELLERLRA